ncbi:acidic leucine-rich nuclear phosphoprotein 32 family member B [Drosophila eugracilis]|uniref:acidic leucine-rich nuclear phosphoprotein 32 family member B n=1 Tax=Drosophila eugracilis TaxID=29029 RepID=UPI0007E791DF|nr:acidic leucine-rich nuclear phosphoprotein 32 family member B [Drosophila eugracilis]
MENYPLASDNIGQKWQNDELMSQLEEEAKKGYKPVAVKDVIFSKMEEPLLDVTPVKLGAANFKENEDIMKQTKAMMQHCMFQINRMEHLLEKAGLQNIIYYAVQRKDLHAQSQIKLLKDQDILELRNIVQQFRQEKGLKYEAEKTVGAIEQELSELDRQWLISIISITDIRKQKKVSIVQMSNLINELQIELPKNPFTSDFLNNLLFKNTRRSNLDNCMEDVPDLESPTLNQFIETVEDFLLQLRELEFLELLEEQMEDALAEFEEDEYSDEEYEDETEDDDEGFEEDEVEEDQGQENEEEEKEVENSEPMLIPVVEEFEMESGSDDKKSGNEPSGEKDPNEQDVNVDEIKSKSDEQKLVELVGNLSVTPKKRQECEITPDKSFNSDDIPTTSNGILNSFTKSQLLKNNIDLEVYEPTPNKRLKLEEEEFSMPEFFKQP